MTTPPQEHVDWLEAHGFSPKEGESNLWENAKGIQFTCTLEGPYPCWGIVFPDPIRGKLAMNGNPGHHPRTIPFRLGIVPCGSPDDDCFALQRMTREPSSEWDRQWLRDHGFSLTTEAVEEGYDFSIEIWERPDFEGYIGYAPLANWHGDFGWAVIQVDFPLGDVRLHQLGIFTNGSGPRFSNETPEAALRAQRRSGASSIVHARREFKRELRRIERERDKEIALRQKQISDLDRILGK